MRGIQVTMHDVLIRGFSEVQTDSISFNDDVFGNIFRCKMWTETRLKAIMVALNIIQMIRSLFRLEKESTMHEHASVLPQDQELLWYQESREKWVCHGNRNTEYFHSLTKIRRSQNHIHGFFLSDGE
ncbi:hypothetical protein OIU79_001834 [Salix purpurea]|uniref:Uncharacterized protein n=1 Tax=Salix purpurea TaxID=77065 RepID=A0A9Q0UR99_SALPP|nr:hypothetical protein OIU79_001834 [Salix purpurea]